MRTGTDSGQRGQIISKSDASRPDQMPGPVSALLAEIFTAKRDGQSLIVAGKIQDYACTTYDIHNTHRQYKKNAIKNKCAN